MVLIRAFEETKPITPANLVLVKSRREWLRFLSIYSSQLNQTLSTPPDLHNKLLTYVLNRQTNQTVEVLNQNSQHFLTPSLSTLEQGIIEELIQQGVNQLINQENGYSLHRYKSI